MRCLPVDQSEKLQSDPEAGSLSLSQAVGHSSTASLGVLWAILVTTIQEGHGNIRECPREGNKEGEGL